MLYYYIIMTKNDYDPKGEKIKCNAIRKDQSNKAHK